MMKKLLAIILVLAMVFAMNAGALATGGATDVDVTIDSAQISVSVPVEFSIEAKVDGGPCTVPTNYKITNLSAIPVKVDTIAVTLNDSTDWAFKATAIAAGAAPTTTGVNDIFMSLNGQVLAVQAATAPTTPANWNIAASSDLAVTIAASTSQLDQTATETDLITITYVISAGTHS